MKLSIEVVGFKRFEKGTLNENDKVIYSPLFEFETRAVRDAFSREVWRALLEFDPDAVSS